MRTHKYKDKQISSIRWSLAKLREGNDSVFFCYVLLTVHLDISV
jgi:hypothetical protein